MMQPAVRHEIRIHRTSQPVARKRPAVGRMLAALYPIDISVSHAGRLIETPEIGPDDSPLAAALIAMAALRDASLCTPARPIRSL